jgi:cell wall-associated NlpC family hydrolase
MVRPMQKSRPLLPRLLAIALCAALGSAVAAPEEAPPAADAVSRFLGEKGLLNPRNLPDLSGVTNSVTSAVKPSPEFVQSMRDRASDMVLSAMNFLGVPYRMGGTSAETGFDCSGFTRHVFEHSLGLLLPRRAEEQANAPGLISVKRDELKPGDLVFFNTLRNTFSHVGIYVGEGKFIHSPRTGSVVRVEDMRFSYWAQRFTGARRPANAAAAAANAATLSADSAALLGNSASTLPAAPTR